MNRTIKSKILIKRGSTSEWTKSSTPLESGELGYNTGSGQLKIGDGSSLWADLPALGQGNLKLTYWGNLATFSGQPPAVTRCSGVVLSVYTDNSYGMCYHNYRTEWSWVDTLGYETYLHLSFTLADLAAAGCPLSTRSSDPLVLKHSFSTGSGQWSHPFLGLTTADGTRLCVDAWLVEIG